MMYILIDDQGIMHASHSLGFDVIYDRGGPGRGGHDPILFFSII